MGSNDSKKEKQARIKPNAPMKKKSKDPMVKKEYDSDSDSRTKHRDIVKNGRKSNKHNGKSGKNSNLPPYCKNESESMAFKRFDDDQVKAINNNPDLPQDHRTNQIQSSYVDKAWEDATKVIIYYT